MGGLHEESFSNFDPYNADSILERSGLAALGSLSEQEAALLITEHADATPLSTPPAHNLVVSTLLACSVEMESADDQPEEEPLAENEAIEAILNSTPETEEPPALVPTATSDGPIKPPTGGNGEITSGEDDENEPTFDVGYARPSDRPELAHYLNDHPETDVEAIAIVPHVPRLIGGIKSTQFIIKEDSDPDTPPDPNETIDLRTVAVPASELKSFSDFFDKVEAQADAQYEAALMETQQMIAETERNGATIDTIFVPDSPNETASGYFRRLTRLAQDTNKTVVVRVVDYEDNYRFESYKRFEPIRATSAEAYWDQRENEIDSSQRRQGIEPEPDDHEAVDALSNLAIPSGEYWDDREGYYALSDQLVTAAAASPENLQRWLGEEGSPTHDKLSVIKEVALSSTDSLRNARGPARTILAKLGDPDGLQQILHELTTETGDNGWESHTINPLGIYIRSDKALQNDVLHKVDQALAQGPEKPYELLSWLGALYYSFDPAIGPALADHLKVPDHHQQTYAANALHAAGRWMPMYAQVVSAMPPSVQRDTALAAIQDRTQGFLDAYNDGRLDGIYQSMMYWPADYLAPMLLSFRNPEHQSTLKECVLTQFKQGGSVLNERGFERLYILYRQQYGDIPEITRHIHTTS